MSDFDPLTPEERDAQFDSDADPKRKTKPRDPRPFVRSSPDAPAFVSRPWRNTKATRSDLYRSPDGAPSLVVERFDWIDQETGAERKVFPQSSLRLGERGPVWVREGFPDNEPLPLFNLPEIVANPERLVVLTEGEKACEAAQIIFGDTAIATTAPMGATSFHRADVSPLAGRIVIVWRDNDTSGEKHLAAAVKALSGIARELLIVDVPNLVTIDGGSRGVTHNPDGWDAADALIEWADPVALRAKVAELAMPDPLEAYLRFDSEAIHQFVAQFRKSPALAMRPEHLAMFAALAERDADAWRLLRACLIDVKVKIRAVDEAVAGKLAALARERARNAPPDTTEEDRQREKDARRAELSEQCKHIAEDPKLIANFVKVVQDSGVVGEERGIKGAYISAASRLARDAPLSVVREGSAAAGKSFLIKKVLSLFPDESIVLLTTASPMALAYMGGEDPLWLSHKIVFIAEAVSIAEREGEVNPLATMLRVILSEGKLVHQVVITRKHGTPITVDVRKLGPIVAMLTTARDNLDDELRTRVVSFKADESADQTIKVVKRTFSESANSVSEEMRVKWISHQLWLELDAPYEVAIPFLDCIGEGFENAHKEDSAIALRARRDATALKSAIGASAILHKAQRKLDDKGRIIATLDDYRIAHEVVEPSTAEAHHIAMPDTMLGVVRALEKLGVRNSGETKVAIRALKDTMGISSTGLAWDRLMTAVDHELVEIVDTPTGKPYGKTSPRYYRLIRDSEETEVLVNAKRRLAVFPPAEKIEELININTRREGGSRNKEQFGPSAEISPQNQKDKRGETVPNPGGTVGGAIWSNAVAVPGIGQDSSGVSQDKPPEMEAGNTAAESNSPSQSGLQETPTPSEGPQRKTLFRRTL
jgi:hypothetical protein